MKPTQWWKDIPQRIQIEDLDVLSRGSELERLLNGSLEPLHASDQTLVFAHFVQLFNARRQGDFSHHGPILDELNDRRTSRFQSSLVETQPASLLEIEGAEFEGREMRADLNVRLVNCLNEDALVRKFLGMLSDDEFAELTLLSRFSPIHGPQQTDLVADAFIARL